MATEPYSTFATATPALSLPILSSDIIVVTRGGLTYQIPGTTFAASTNAYTYNSPTSGQTIVMAAGELFLIIDPAGAIAALTVTLPPSPTDGQRARLLTTQDITTLTVNAPAGATVKGSGVTLAGNGGYGFIYRAANTTWYAGA